MFGITTQHQRLPLSTIQNEKPSNSSRLALKVVAATAATFMGAGMLYYGRQHFGAGREENENAKLGPRTAITARAMPTIEMDLMQNQLADITNGNLFELKIDGNAYCQDPKMVTVTSTDALPSWMQISYPLIGSYPTATSAKDLTLIGNTAYVVVGNSLLFIDISNASKPTQLGNITILGAYQISATVVVNTAYVASGSKALPLSLQIIDISNKTKPILLGKYSDPIGEYTGTGTWPRFAVPKMTVVGGIAYIAKALYMLPLNRLLPVLDGLSVDGVLDIIDVRNNSNPKKLGNYSLSSSNGDIDITVVGNIAYISTEELEIIDVSNSAKPTSLGSYNLDEYKDDSSLSFSADFINGNTVIGSRAYIADTFGFQILDVNNLTKPIRLGRYNTSRYTADISVIGNRAYLADSTGSMQVIDINNVVNLALLGNLENAKGLQVAMMNQPGYLTNGLQIFSLREPFIHGFPNTVGQSNLKVTVECADKTVVDTFSLTTTKFPQNKVVILNDLSKKPAENFQISFKGESFFSSKTTSFLNIRARESGKTSLPNWLTFEAKPQRMQIYEIAFSSTSTCYGKVAVSNGILCIATCFDPWVIIDVKDPNNPALLTKYSESVNWGLLLGNTAYVSLGWNDFYIIDMTNPSTPIKVNLFPVSTPVYDIAVLNNIAYVLDYKGLKLFNIANKTNPILLGKVSCANREGVAVFDDTAYVTRDDGSLTIIDISNKAKPLISGTYPILNASLPIYDIKVKGKTVYVTQGNRIQLIDVSDKKRPVILSNFSIPDTANEITLLGNTAYVTSGVGGLQIVDISDPKNPKYFSQFATTYPALSTAISGPFAYISGGDQATLKGAVDIVDLDNWQLTGSPTFADVGNHEIEIIASDQYGASVTDSFVIRIEGAPVLNNPFHTQQLKTNTPFTYFIDKLAFKDPNGDSLTYSASLANGDPLPEWLTFNPTIPAFLGTPKPSDAGTLNLLIYAKDADHEPISAPFQLTISHDNRQPQVANPISSMTASVNKLFQYVIPSTTFNDPDGDELKYSAALASGHPLPSWVKFDAASRTFQGTPGPQDTDFYADRQLEISLTASDSVATASTNFMIAVSGESYPEKVIKIGLPTLSALTTLFGLYKKRAWVLNVMNKRKYTKDNLTLTVGQAFSHQFACDPQNVRDITTSMILKNGIKTKLYTQMDRSRFLCHKNLQNWTKIPNGMPNWLEYDVLTATLYSESGAPNFGHLGPMRVKAIGDAGVILEQFEIHVVGNTTAHDHNTLRTSLPTSLHTSWGEEIDTVPLASMGQAPLIEAEQGEMAPQEQLRF